MPELERQPSGKDPIASLHKMSTTAGVGVGEYVAINNLAITATLLGLGTALVFVAWPLIMLGGAAIICGIIGLWQVRKSNGTQSGRVLAWMGILLSVLIAGGWGANEARREMALRPEEEKINQLIEQMSQFVSAGEFGKAYELTGAPFREKVSLAQFESGWKLTQQEMGALQSMRGNNYFDFAPEETGAITARTMAELHFAKAASDVRIRLELRKERGEQWRFIIIGLFDSSGLL